MREWGMCVGVWTVNRENQNIKSTFWLLSFIQFFPGFLWPFMHACSQCSQIYVHLLNTFAAYDLTSILSVWLSHRTIFCICLMLGLFRCAGSHCAVFAYLFIFCWFDYIRSDNPASVFFPKCLAFAMIMSPCLVISYLMRSHTKSVFPPKPNEKNTKLTQLMCT